MEGVFCHSWACSVEQVCYLHHLWRLRDNSCWSLRYRMERKKKKAFSGIWKGFYRVCFGSGSDSSHYSPEGRAEHVGMQKLELFSGFASRLFSLFKYLCNSSLKWNIRFWRHFWDSFPSRKGVTVPPGDCDHHGVLQQKCENGMLIHE